MSSFRLSSSPILSLQVPAAPGQTTTAGVTVTERSRVTLCSVLARKGKTAQLIERVRTEFGVELPRTPRRVGGEGLAFIWAGPDQWLALGQGDDGKAFERQLRSTLAEAAALTDQSDGRTILRITGPGVREALAKGVHIDLHPNAFRPGDTAITAVAYINVHFWQVDDAPTFEVAVFRSFALAFWQWLAASAAEYGLETRAR